MLTTSFPWTRVGSTSRRGSMSVLNSPVTLAPGSPPMPRSAGPSSAFEAVSLASSVSDARCKITSILGDSGLVAAVSMPLDVGPGFASSSHPRDAWRVRGFYALDVGRGFATILRFGNVAQKEAEFLCPRYRAGLCDPTVTSGRTRPSRRKRFYALGSCGFARRCEGHVGRVPGNPAKRGL